MKLYAVVLKSMIDSNAIIRGLFLSESDAQNEVLACKNTLSYSYYEGSVKEVEVDDKSFQKKLDKLLK